MCEYGMNCLHKKLKKIRAMSPTGSKWNIMVRANLQRALHPFRETTLVKLKEISSDLQDHLYLALNVLHV